MKRQMEISQHCWKFIYKDSDISIMLYVTDFIFYNFFLPAQEWEKYFCKEIQQQWHLSIKYEKGWQWVLFRLWKWWNMEEKVL